MHLHSFSKKNFLFYLFLLFATGVVYAKPPLSKARLQAIAKMTRAEQQAVDVQQRDLQRYLARAALLYLHGLDRLSCQTLFSLGDPATFIRAIGNTDGSDLNRVYIDDVTTPQHLGGCPRTRHLSKRPKICPIHHVFSSNIANILLKSVKNGPKFWNLLSACQFSDSLLDGGPYVFPLDIIPTYYPPDSTMNTYWHEVNHALLYGAGLEIEPDLYAYSLDDKSDKDTHHAFIEGVGQRGRDAYFCLLAFEKVAREASLKQASMEKKFPLTYAEIREVWGKAHQMFSLFITKWRKSARMHKTLLDEYRDVTGVYFSPPPDIVDFYLKGGLKQSKKSTDTVFPP